MNNEENFDSLFAGAKNGDDSAFEMLLEKYSPLLKKESVINGSFDEDLFQELCIVFMKCIRRFSIEKE